MPFDEQITDDALLNAVRKRLLQEIMREQESNQIINNIVGGGQAPPSGGSIPPGMFEGMRGQEQGEPDMDYGVDITRADVWADPSKPGELLPIGVMPPAGPEGKYPDSIGWQKTVRRFRTPRGQEIETQKKK